MFKIFEKQELSKEYKIKVVSERLTYALGFDISSASKAFITLKLEELKKLTH